ncbi:MAG: 16S rRNA (cytosine(1402)-N(4))-methyltransferase RsmH [Candidatus Zixiibacteriota bacterium]|nr:MAG: 16S rRNA (cytosine(1402)-N(4))-methyltransferase RsmH [candidate division Zixibacteria bacterium]
MKGSNGGHEPVLVQQVVRYLATVLDGAYLDLTVGPGGHLKALAQALEQDARLYGVDRDAAAVRLAQKNLQGLPQVKAIIRTSYSRVDSVVSEFGDTSFDGILLDLGISSLQLDDPRRGFSFRYDGPLDMRFDTGSDEPTAADLINTLGENELANIIRNFGEQRNAGQLARAIVRERQSKMLRTTAELRDLILKTAKTSQEHKTLARVFQAFRIAVNKELEHLEAVLPMAVDLVSKGGRLAVISYHSLEDRMVKRYMRQQVKGCVCPETFDVCVCGRRPSLKMVTRRAVTASPQEQQLNPRSRSAKLRVAEKIT